MGLSALDKLKAENTLLAAHNLELEDEVTSLVDRQRRTDEELRQWRTVPCIALHCIALNCNDKRAHCC
jgi:hypothetical protein